MTRKAYLAGALILGLGISACGDSKDSAEKQAEAQRAIQQGMQKERAMIEGMQKGAENLEKQAAEQKAAEKK